jgi:hypothetical protein
MPTESGFPEYELKENLDYLWLDNLLDTDYFDKPWIWEKYSKLIESIDYDIK